MLFIKHDGGRSQSGYRGATGDCVCRAISIVTGRPYLEVYATIREIAKTERRTKKSSPRTGVSKNTTRKLMAHYGLVWTPVMTIGQGCKVHLRDGELPLGRLVVQVTRHVTAVIDGVIHDTYDCSRDGTRCVYGYWTLQ